MSNNNAFDSKDIFEKKVTELNNKERYSFKDLCSIMELLRCDNGCDWDKEQTHASIRKNLIEETYEVVEAIDNDDTALMREELGDVLLQVVFHSQISKDEGRFDIDDVTDELCKKLIVRHPHVFSSVSVSGSDNVLKNWDAIKIKTKNFSTITESMNSITQAMPSLMRGVKIGEKAAKGGFDYESALEALGKVKEEVAEVEEAIKHGNKTDVSEEIGDLLLAVASVSRLAKIDPEQALFNANNKFIGRFSFVEDMVKKSQRTLHDCNREEKISLWKQSKEKR